MRNYVIILIGLFLLAGNCGLSFADPAEKNWGDATYEILKLALADGSVSTAAFFDGGQRQAVAFIPGGSARKENYFSLATQLQKIKIASLSLDERSEYAVLAAIDYLNRKGFDEVVFVGGSVGAGTILTTIKYSLKKAQTTPIKKIILIGPYGGSALKTDKINKLFIAAKLDSISPLSSIQSLYEDTSEPKILKLYQGSGHAEQLLEGEHKSEVAEMILDFIQLN